MMQPKIGGAFAALVTPVDERGQVDLPAFDHLLEFVLERGVDGVVIGGATGEYVHSDIADRVRVSARAVERAAGRARVFTCVGTSSIFTTLRMARAAADAGNEALLLPMPSFFRYAQQDLAAFCEEVCRSVPAQFLLYNLPSFTTPLETATAVRLLNSVPNLAGIKDSSGAPGNLDAFVHARGAGGGFSLLVGDDRLLLSAQRAGWDGVISGIACFAPELVAATYRAHRAGQAERASALQAMVDEIIERLVGLPVPWAVRVGLEVRGVPNGPMHLPLSPARVRQVAEFRSWLKGWAARHQLPVDGVWMFERAA